MVAEAVIKQMALLNTDFEMVARAAQVSPNTVRAVVAGKSWPQLSTRSRLELALGWSPGAFEQIAIRGHHYSPIHEFSDRELAAEQMRRAHLRGRIEGF